MREILLGCEILKDELTASIGRTGWRGEVLWLPRQLHTKPSMLRDEILRTIALNPGYDTFLLAMAQCGNALLNVSSDKRLILPKFADCLQMLQSFTPGSLAMLDPGVLYLTRGWLMGERSTISEYNRVCDKYGELKAEKIYSKIYAHYREVAMIDTGDYPLREAEPGGRQTAQLLHLSYRTIPGTPRVLDKLLRHQWDDEFIALPPNTPLTANLFGM